MAKAKKAKSTKRKAKKPRSLPALERLHERHRGLTPAVCAAFAEAATVCLDRRHVPPQVLALETPSGNTTRSLEWQPSNDRARAAWANRDDATRDGAYSVSLAVVEADLGWVALSRAETRTGADYYVGPRRSRDLENAYRLEVSGVDEGDDAAVNRRVTEKVRQALDGRSALPAVAAVVGFRSARVVIREADSDA